jgi:uncharacterized protein YhaN
MKFLALTYRKFGPFDRLSLDLSQGQHSLHVIYGANETGKTTALRGLGFFLFGFPHLTCDDFRHKHTEQRVGATLVGRDGRQLTCLRRRGNKNTLRAADDKTPVAEEVLSHLLGGINAEQFDMLFGLSHDRLVTGGRAIAEGQGEIGAALFEAGTGLAGLRRLDKRLGEQQGALYKPRGQNQTIALALGEFKTTQDRLREVMLRIDAWTAQEEALRHAGAAKKRLEDERKSNRSEAARLGAFRAALPTVGALQELEGRLAPLAPAPLLHDDFADEHRSAVEALLVARNNLAKSRDDVRQLNDELRTLELPAAILAEEAAIEKMERDLGVGLKAWRDRVDLNARMREHQGKARLILKGNFGRQQLDEAEQLRLSPADTERIRRLSEARQALLDAIEAQQDRLADLEGTIAEKEQLQREALPPPDVSALKALVQAWTKEGPLEKNLRGAEQKLVLDTQLAQAGLKKLALCWKGSLDQVSGLAVPLSATVQRYQHLLQGLDEQVRDRDRRFQEIESTIRQLDEQIKGLLREGAIPTEEDLHTQRADRDAGLELVRRDWLQGGAGPARQEFIRRHAPDRDLLGAVQASVQACDELADTMRAETERVTRLADCRSKLQAAEQKRAELTDELTELRKSRGATQSAWLDVWKPAGVTPRTPFEMHEWLQELASLRRQADTLGAASSAAEQLRAQIEQGKDRLREALGLTDGEGDRALAHLLELAGQRVEEAAEQRRAREQLDERARELRREYARAELAHTRARAAFADWEQQWGEAVAVINLSARDEPATAALYLDQRTEMFRELREAGTLELRIKGIDRDREQFLAALGALRARLDGPQRSASTVETAEADVGALRHRLKEARDLRARRELLEKKRNQGAEHHRELADEVERLEARLETLRQEAGVADVGGLPEAVRRSEERRRLEQRVEEERARLREQARGQPLEAFIAEARAAREGLEARLQELEARSEPLDLEINQQVEAESAARQKLNEWQQASTEAAECRQRAEHLLARLREQVTDFAVLQLAREVLKRALEGFRQKNQGTLLGRAEQFFRALTAGAFQGLEVEDTEEGQPELLAVRARPEERLRIACLSDGTRDQLFLSLRLAGIEQHLTTREPMPLIVDDVLVNYDDQRALATLRCLAELSGQTQVLFFTHHAHLVELARNAISSDCLCCHSLGAEGAG